MSKSKKQQYCNNTSENTGGYSNGGYSKGTGNCNMCHAIFMTHDDDGDEIKERCTNVKSGYSWFCSEHGNLK